MTEFEDKYKIIDELLDFDPDLSESKIDCHRFATRYLRDDIEVIFYKIDFFTRFGFNFLRRMIPAKLLDLSSKGALIFTDNKIGIPARIVLELKFDTCKQFRIKALIIRTSTTESGYRYGIKFDKSNNELGDYLIETQRELRFK